MNHYAKFAAKKERVMDILTRAQVQPHARTPYPNATSPCSTEILLRVKR